MNTSLGRSLSIAIFLFVTTAVADAFAADQCQFIRDALAQLPAQGGTVTVPAGHYTCSTPIVLDRPFAKLEGQGEAILKLADRADSPLIIMGSIVTPPRIVEDIEVANLILDGNMDNQIHECWGGNCDEGGTKFIRNNGITIRGVHGGRVRDVKIFRARSGGLVTEKNCRFLRIDRLVSTHNFFDGFAGYETYDSSFANMELSHNGAAGISIDIRFDNNVVRDTRIFKNHDVGIFMRDSDSNRFQNVQILESGNHGIFLAYDIEPMSCAFNNEFENLKVVSSRYAGFRLNNACTGNRLTGRAEFYGNGGPCISEGTNIPLAINGELICEKEVPKNE